MKDKYLLLPKSFFKTKSQLREEMPQFSVRVFECYYEDDAEKFTKLVESKHGIVLKSIKTDSLNYKNQPVFL